MIPENGKESPNQLEENDEEPNNVSKGLEMEPSVSESVSMKEIMDDAYYQGLEELVDIALRSITAKLSEKKSAELENSSLKVMIGKVREDIKREEQTQKSLKKAIDQERETRKKKDRENAELKQSLDIMNDKAEVRKSEIDRDIYVCSKAVHCKFP